MAKKPAAAPAFTVEGLKETQRALRKMGGTPDDQRKLNRHVIDQLIIPRVKIEIPVRSGALMQSLRSDATAYHGWIIAGRVEYVNYAGVIHFGWATRGMGYGATRKQLYQAFLKSQTLGAEAVFGKKAVYKATRRTKQDKGPLIERDTTGRYTSMTHRSTQIVRNRIRGGPIKPNPFIYSAIDDRRQGVIEEFARQLEQRARIQELL